MGKRFTDTDKWDDPWWSELSPNDKLIWLYVLDKCNHIGFFKPNKKAIILYCDLPLDTSIDTIKEKLSNRVYVIGDEWFIPKFLKFQYPKGLTSNKPAIVSARNTLLNHKHYDTIKELLENYSITIEQSLSNDKPIIKDKRKDKETNKDKEQLGQAEFSEFVIRWNTIASEYGLPVVKKLSRSRSDKLKARITEGLTVECLEQIGEKIKASSFIKNGKWCNFDWIMENDKNYNKILEGNYDDNDRSNTGQMQRNVIADAEPADKFAGRD